MKCIKYLVLFLALPAMAGTAMATEKVKIVTSNDRPTECISQVRINNINGREVRVPPLAFEVEAGTHTMTGRAMIDNRFCRSSLNRNPREKIKPLEAEFEAGKVYYLGYDHSAADRKDWGLTIWKVEDAD